MSFFCCVNVLFYVCKTLMNFESLFYKFESSSCFTNLSPVRVLQVQSSPRFTTCQFGHEPESYKELRAKQELKRNETLSSAKSFQRVMHLSTDCPGGTTPGHPGTLQKQF